MLTDNWRGTTTQFLHHFKEQLRLLDSLVPMDEHLPDSTRMVFLQRAVEGVPDLRRVRILDGMMTADTIPTKNGRELMEKWVSDLKDKFLGPNWQRMLSCAYTTQLLHSTGEVCWNNRDSYFIWFEFVC